MPELRRCLSHGWSKVATKCEKELGRSRSTSLSSWQFLGAGEGSVCICARIMTHHLPLDMRGDQGEYYLRSELANSGQGGVVPSDGVAHNDHPDGKTEHPKPSVPEDPHVTVIEVGTRLTSIEVDKAGSPGQTTPSTFRRFSVPPVVTVYRKGTLVLFVGNPITESIGPQRIVVSPHVLSDLSPVLHQLYKKDSERHGKWSHKRKTRLDLPNDNPDVMIQIMYIAHLQFDKVAPSLTFPQLVDLALASQRYETSKILIPFLSRWTAQYRGEYLQPGREEWLFVAYQFGFEEDFRRLARHLVFNCRINDHGHLIGTSGRPLEGAFPKGTICKLFPYSQHLPRRS